MFTRVRSWAQAIKRDVFAVYLAARDPRVPWLAKVMAGLVAAYAVSPIDLIPDFIPILGYLDDLIVLPIGILLVIRLVPEPIMDDLRRQAATRLAGELPTDLKGAVVIVTLWCLIVGAAVLFLTNVAWAPWEIIVDKVPSALQLGWAGPLRWIVVPR